MINTKTSKRYIRKEKCNGYLTEYGISDEEFEQKMQEAEEDIKNGNLYSLEEVMNKGLEVLENIMSELSEKEQIEAKNYINYWRNRFE